MGTIAARPAPPFFLDKKGDIGISIVVTLKLRVFKALRISEGGIHAVFGP